MSGDLDKPGATRPYRMLSLVELIGLVVDQANSEALHEFHEYRRVFHHHESGVLLFAEYLSAIRNQHLSSNKRVNSASIIDRAYDLTVLKFLNLPQVHASGLESEQRAQNTDCRHYFRAFLRALSERKDPSGSTPIRAHRATGQLLQGLVNRQFRLSILEATRRSEENARRYSWTVNGGTVTVWLPKHMSGQDCQTWLMNNVQNPNPSRPQEKERIQAIVDSWFGDRRILQLSTIHNHAQRVSSSDTRAGDMDAPQLSPVSLAIAVADEKAADLKQLRPSIRNLGPEKIRQLILNIFRNLVDGQLSDQQIAEEFGLTKPTFSRFAGRNWTARSLPGGDPQALPDLFRNTAQVLASTPAFAEVARDTSTWSFIEEVAHES